jgi:hypothetical protein
MHTINDAAAYLCEMFGSEDCPGDPADAIRAAMREANIYRYEDITHAVMARAYDIANADPDADPNADPDADPNDDPDADPDADPNDEPDDEPSRRAPEPVAPGPRG